jgi:hypothetical protein
VINPIRKLKIIPYKNIVAIANFFSIAVAPYSSKCDSTSNMIPSDRTIETIRIKRNISFT